MMNTVRNPHLVVRESNLELYRIILMLAIIAHHYVVNSGLMPILHSHPNSLKSTFFFIFGMWGKTGINCFVLITGYFMCKSQITLKKFVKLITEVVFYNVLIFILFIVCGYTVFTWKDCFYAFLPIKSISDGFTSCFLVFYLLIPFLNILVKNMNQCQHQELIGLFLFLFTFLGTIPFIDLKMNYIEWFCVLFFISSYIHLYGLPNNYFTKHIGRVLAGAIVLAILTVIAMVKFEKTPYLFVSDSNHLMAVVVSVCAFLFFKTIYIPYCKIINTIAKSVFGVFLIHANSDTMRQWLWYDIFNVKEQYQSDYSILYAVITIAFIFVICIIIDYIRILSIERPLFSYMDKIGIFDKFTTIIKNKIDNELFRKNSNS